MLRKWIELVESEQDDQDRLKRAIALGFDTSDPMYHGTRAGKFDAFRTNFRKNEQLGFGIHFTPVKDFADRYAFDQDVARKGKSPYVHICYIRKGNVLRADRIVHEGTPEFKLALKLGGKKVYVTKDENGVRCCYLQNAIDATSPQRAAKIIQEAGYDTVVYNAKIVNLGAPGQYTTTGEALTYIVLDPKNIRSADAQFDPSKSDSSDLMA